MNSKEQLLNQVLGKYMQIAQNARYASAESQQRAANAGMATMRNNAERGQLSQQEAMLSAQPMNQYLGM
ncbi:hypothetical protein [Synechococcus elongatus]|uniref:hypothetical protein n=1 Tax=Synechococcus elongatus TaxID=32046 RepID=UPI0012602011|nr:hypothetical protein [Synechococcus elongatus]